MRAVGLLRARCVRTDLVGGRGRTHGRGSADHGPELCGERRTMPNQTTIDESERWLSVIAGGMLILSSLRRRDLAAGALLALGGSALVYRGVAGHDGWVSGLRDARTGAPAGD